jgi:hypothetical protein
VVTATDPTIEDWYFEPARAAVWGAVADRVGAGIGSAEPVDSDEDLQVPRTLDEFIDRLFAGPVTFRALGIEPLDDDRLAEQLPNTLVGAFGPDSVDAVSVHDRAETLMVMGAVAPGRIGAPLDAPSFRIVSGFSSDDLDDLGLNNADVLKRAIDGLIFTQVNVVSVADVAGSEVPEVTRIVVADPSVIEGVEQTYGPLFGEIEVVAA